MLGEVALGWCEAGQVPPTGIAAKPLAGLALLSALAATPHDVLTLQQLCFDQGLDLLPLSPARLCPAIDAAEQGDVIALTSQLKAIRGMAQISLDLQWDEPTDLQSSGRDWLTSRRKRATRSAMAATWLTDLARTLQLQASPVELRPGGAVIHLLVRRDALPSTETLAHRAGPLDLSGARLTLIGPWPPIAFAAAFR
jgi:hypothetical protein